MAPAPPGHLTAAEVLDYLRAFNTKDYARQHSFYASDVQLLLPDPAIPPLKSSSGIRTHYGPIHDNADETVIPIIIMCDRGRVYIQMETYFVYKKEVQRAVHDYHVFPGDVIKITSCAVYDIDAENKMQKIVCHLFEQELLGKVDAKERIRESESRADDDLKL